MKKILICVILACVPFMYAGEGFASRVPADTVVYAYIDAQEYIKQANEYNPVIEAFQKEGKLKSFIDPLAKELEKNLKKLEAEFDLDISIKESLDLLKTEIGVVIAGEQFAKSDNYPSAVLMIKVKEENKKKFQAILALIKKKLLENPEGEKRYEVGTLEIAGTEFTRISFLPPKLEDSLKDLPEDMAAATRQKIVDSYKKANEQQAKVCKQNPVIFGIHNDIFCVSNSEQLTGRICIPSEEGEALSAQAEYTEAMNKVDGDKAPLKIYFSVLRLIPLIKKGFAKEEGGGQNQQAIVDKVMKYGLSSLKSISLANTFQEKTLHMRGFLAFPGGDDEGILKSLLKNRGTPVIHPCVHQEAYIVTGTKIDLTALYNEVIKLVKALNPAYIMVWQQQKDVLKQQQGIDIDQLIQSVGDNVMAYLYPLKKPEKEVKEPGDIPPDMGLTDNIVFIIDLKDAEPLKKLLASVIPAGQEGGPIAKSEFMGDTVYKINMPMDTGMNIAFGICSGRFVFASQDEELRAVIRRGSSKEYRLSEPVAQALKKLSAMDPQGSMMGFEQAERNRHVVGQLFNKQFRQIMQEMLKEFKIQIDPNNVPTYEDLKQYLNIDSYSKGGMIEGGYLIRTEAINRRKEEE
ncbi:hypothetical protein ACFL6F_03700 [Planctomycetota bacterium]